MRPLVEEVYAALGRGDADTLKRALHPDFVGTVSAGMPTGGGQHQGADAMISDAWWAIGRSYRVQPYPQEWIACADGRLLVIGVYRGSARADGHEVEAAFAHLWTGDGKQLTSIVQITDTARW